MNNNIRLSFFGSGLLIALLTMNGHLSWVQSIRAESEITNAKASTLQRQKEDLEIARQRFEGGCTIVTNEKGDYVTLTEGMRIHGRGSANKDSVPNGMTACDMWGNTGIIQDGVLSQFASNPNYPKQ
jgi:hypothetical protein